MSANEIDPDIIEYVPIEKKTVLKPPAAITSNLSSMPSIDNPWAVGDEAVEIEQKGNDIGDEEQEGQTAILVQNAGFSWDDKQNQLALRDINVRFKHGTTTMLIGETGSGKSALLRAILGNLTKTQGRIVYGESLLHPGQHIKVAYSSQVAWIQNARLRDNVLFGNAFDQKLYDKVIEACALKDDLKILPGGDETEIGEKGINLSGGMLTVYFEYFSSDLMGTFDDEI